MLDIYDYTLEELIDLDGNSSSWGLAFLEPSSTFFSASGDYQNAYKLSTNNYAKYAYRAVMERILDCVVLLTSQHLEEIVDPGLQPAINQFPIIYKLVRSWNRWLVPKLSRLVGLQTIFYEDVSTPTKANYLKSLGMTDEDLTATLERKHRFNDSPENVTDPDSDSWLTEYSKDETSSKDPSKMTKQDYLDTLEKVFSDYLDKLEIDFLKAFGYTPRLEVR